VDRRGSIGIGVAVAVGLIFVIYLSYETEYEDARLARVQANYNDESDRLQVIIILTDSNGDYTKANGNAEVTVQKDGRMVYSNKYDFVKNDFVTWKNNLGGKTTGYMIDIRQFFSNGWHDVFVDLNTKSGYWEDLHDRFYPLH